MSPAYRRYLPFAAGAALAVLLVLSLLRVRYELEMTRETARLHTVLEGVATAIRVQLESGYRLTEQKKPAAAGHWQAWELSPTAYSSANDRAPLIGARSLRRALQAQPKTFDNALLLGPFATDDGGNALTLVRPPRLEASGLVWHGSSVSLRELLDVPAIADLMRQGYRIRLDDRSRDIPLYQSDEGELLQPVQAEILVGAARLQLSAAPRAGWHLPVRWWSSSLMVLLAVFLWLAVELRRGRELRTAREDLEETNLRRQEANTLYGKALESVGALEARLQVVSMYDTVTGLANRSSLVHRVESALDALRQAPNGSLGVLTIGFDHVHHITNSFGADFASRVLVVAAERVEFVLPSRDLLFRIGDFQLAVVVPNAATGACELLAKKIIEEIEAPIAMDSHTFMLHPSIGIVESHSGYQYAEALLDHANTALGAVPRDSASRYCVFDSSTAKESVSRLQLEVDLSKAFDENQFVLEYEPIVMPVTHAVAGFEALIRWNHPTEGRLSPGRFLPIAVQAGMSHRLNHWVMREAARQASLWRRAGYDNLFVNFNLSAEAFLRPNLEEEIGELLAEFELPGQCLLVELTESTLIQDLRGAARTLQRLSELGIRAWLDDFGTGYSSLSYLRALPLRGVKIDRSFIERTVIDARDFGFLKSLIDLISYLGMQSIAEGIETQEQYELLSLTTCDLYQGWHFSHSMSAEKAERWMNDMGAKARREKIA